MAGVNPWGRLKDGDPPELRIWPVFRTYPIRVAGNSGPMYQELDWASLAERTDGYIQPERTTVTQKVRRIGEWDAGLAFRAMVANGHPSLVLNPVLTFVDYWFPELANVTDREILDKHDDLWASIQTVENDLGARLAAFTNGPDTLVSLL
jgi:adenylosuccinate synthase